MNKTMENKEIREESGDQALPEFVNVHYLLRALALLKGETEKKCEWLLRDAIASNNGEIFAGLVDFLSDMFERL